MADDGLNKVIVGVSGALIVGLLSWVGYTLTSTLTAIQTQQARFDEKLDNLIDKSREILPRSENERRYTAIENSIQTNSDRISKVEQYLLNQKAR